mmetsp:Transcript_57680/g.122715  ORF Transcript_57680/g.122715 Transcript_57680/m.122715 type:complete len:206 (-) Transcript_57680:878-1495(-)
MSKEFNGCLLGELEYDTLPCCFIGLLIDKGGQALNELPENTFRSNLGLASHLGEDKKVRLLHRDSLALAFLQAGQNVIQCTVRSQNIETVLHNTKQSPSIPRGLIVHREGILPRADNGASNADEQELLVDTEELIDLGIGFWLFAGLLCELRPEVEGDAADFLIRQICASQQHSKDQIDFLIPNLIHDDERNKAFTNINIDAANM